MKIVPFLMFQGSAEEAMNTYVSVFPDAAIVHIDRYGGEGPGKEGTVKTARFRVAGLEVMCIDSPVAHNFSFTPATSLFVDFDDRAALDRVFAALSAGGKVLMPPDAYGFSTFFAWIEDRFGVSWQLNLP
jgi:predicted 3-demethylubiquinone-9 3-methyltransferase (glyoxalase superfamily)